MHPGVEIPGAVVGQTLLCGLYGELKVSSIWFTAAPAKNFAFEVQDTCQLDLGWPELFSVVSKQPQETEPGLQTICLSYWQGCDAGSKGS